MAAQGNDRMSPSFAMPAGACDCHVHVFGPSARFPMHPARGYTPGRASAAELAVHQRALGLERVVVVQPSVYGTDNSCTLDAVARLGPAARGIAVVDPAAPAEELAALRRGGICGIRLNLVADGVAEPEPARDALRKAGETAAATGWHVQVFAALGLIAALADDLLACPVPMVIDHFGLASAEKGPSQEGFAALLGLVGSGKAYVKLSAPYQISDAADHGDVEPLARALAAANPGRLLWGSNWPHPGGGAPGPDGITPFRTVDDGAVLDRLARWIGDPAVMEALLVTNPARLYGFGEGEA